MSPGGSLKIFREQSAERYSFRSAVVTFAVPSGNEIRLCICSTHARAKVID